MGDCSQRGASLWKNMHLVGKEYSEHKPSLCLHRSNETISIHSNTSTGCKMWYLAIPWMLPASAPVGSELARESLRRSIALNTIINYQSILEFIKHILHVCTTKIIYTDVSLITQTIIHFDENRAKLTFAVMGGIALKGPLVTWWDAHAPPQRGQSSENIQGWRIFFAKL